MKKMEFAGFALIGASVVTAFGAGFYIGFKKGVKTTKELEEIFDETNLEPFDNDWREVDDTSSLEERENVTNDTENLEDEVKGDVTDEEIATDDFSDNENHSKVTDIEKTNTNTKTIELEERHKIIIIDNFPCLFLNKENDINKIMLTIDRKKIQMYDLHLNDANQELFTLYNYYKAARIHRDPDYKGIVVSVKNMTDKVKKSIHIVESGDMMTMNEYVETFKDYSDGVILKDNKKEEAS